MEEMGTKTSIKVNKETKELLEAKRMDLTGIEHNRIVDLSVDGDRWEGDVLNGEPCGWGVVYDKDNNKVYEGFRVDGVDACYGRSYYPGTSQIEYDGMLCDGKRHGKGVQLPCGQACHITTHRTGSAALPNRSPHHRRRVVQQGDMETA